MLNQIYEKNWNSNISMVDNFLEAKNCIKMKRTLSTLSTNLLVSLKCRVNERRIIKKKPRNVINRLIFLIQIKRRCY